MCSACSYNYNQFSTLNSQLSRVVDQVSECITSTKNVGSVLSSVIICGSSIDKDDINKINQRLETILSGLQLLMQQCSSQMTIISNSCPGEDHYKNN